MSPASPYSTLAGETSFYALFRYATVGIVVIGPNGIIQLANPWTEKIFDYKSYELEGKPVELLMPQGLRKRHIQHREKYFENPKSRPMGYGLNLFARKKNGEEFPVEISLGHYELDGEQKAVAFITDISGRTKAEDNAKRSEKEYRFIFEGIQESFIQQRIIRDNEGKVVDLVFLEINPATEKIIKKSRHEIIGHFRSEFFGPLDATLIDIIHRVEQHKEHIRHQQYIEPIGRWFDRSFYSLRPGELITLSIDITQQKKDEEDLRNKQAMLEAEASALSFLNKSGTFLSGIDKLEPGLEKILDGAIELMGADKGNVQLLDMEKQVLNIVAAKGLPKEFLEHFKEVSAEDKSACGRALKAKSQIIIEDTETDISFIQHREIARFSCFRSVLSTPLFGQDGTPMGMISTHFSYPRKFTEHDLNIMTLYAQQAESFITRQKMYEALEKTNMTLERKVEDRTKLLSQSLERERELNHLKSRFVSIASHEFRTPLSTILSSVSLIESYNKEEQEIKRKKHTDRIKTSIKSLVDILDEFLSLEKLERGDMEIKHEIVNLHDFALSIVEEISTVLRKGQYIEFSCENAESIALDRKMLKGILMNLLSNAIKYSAEEKRIHLAINSEENFISINVQDEGIGIPEEEQNKLFTEFYRAGNVGSIQGTGLGLNIVKKYVDLLQGKISFVSKQNEGTVFTIKLPK